MIAIYNLITTDQLLEKRSELIEWNQLHEFARGNDIWINKSIILSIIEEQLYKRNINI